MTLSIIMPVLNEASVLPGQLVRLDILRRGGAEIILADGGSTDGTIGIILASGARLVAAAKGRARQMNAGASAASGDILLFLHADTRLPEHADRLIAAALADGRWMWGRFDVRIEGRSMLLGIVARAMNIRSRATGIATGDQAIFVTREAFEKVGGFPDQPLMEDIELSKRLLTLSRPVCLDDRVTTSGRRWDERGAIRTIWLMWRLRWAYWRGVSPERLAEAYR